MSVVISGSNIQFAGTTNVVGDLTENSWSFVGSSYSGAAAIASDGTLYRWGARVYGQIGDGTTATAGRSSPVQIAGSWSIARGGWQHMLGIKTDGTLWAWGYNAMGELGQGNSTYRSSPVQIGTSSWTDIGSAFESSFAIRSDGTLWAWGDNLNYTLGVGEFADSAYSSPVQVGTATNWSKLMNGRTGTEMAAIKTDGSLWQWGSDTYGGYSFATPYDLDDAGVFIIWAPKQVGTSSWTMISGTDAEYAAIRADGGLFTWGVDPTMLGDDTNVNPRSSPVQLGTDSWTTVAVSAESMYALRADGALFAWGYNTYGQLGLGDKTNRLSPVQIGTSSWVTVTTGENAVYAIRADKTVWAWGLGTLGRLGTNTNVARSSPVQVALAALPSVWP